MKLLSLRKYLRRYICDERGAALVEYAMLVGLVAIICLAAVESFGLEVQTTMNFVVEGLNLPGSSTP